MRTFLLASFFLLACKAFAQEPVDNQYLLDLFQSQRYLEAADYMQKAYPEPVSDKKVLARIGYGFKMAGKYSEAERYYGRILEQDSTDLPALFNLAVISQAKGNTTRATDFYKLILKVDSNNFSVYKQLADMIESSRDLPSATPYLAKANALNPQDPDVAYSFAKTLILVKQFPKAEAVLDSAIAADTTNLILTRGKAELAYQQEKWATTVAACKKLLANGESNAAILRMLGYAHFRLEQFQDAIGIFKVMETSGFVSEGTFYYMALSYKGLKNYPRALEYMQKTVGAAISENISDYYAQIGDINARSNRTRQALTAYQKSISYQSKPMTLYAMAFLYDQRLKDTSSAIRYYKRYLDSKPPADHTVYVDYTKSRIMQLAR